MEMQNLAVITIGELTTLTTSRSRGKEAVQKLASRLHEFPEGTTILLDLTSSPVVSMSFLDELVLETSRRGVDKSPAIAFRLGTTRHLAQLEEICTLRKTKCFYQYGADGPIRKTRRRTIPTTLANEYPGAFFDSV